MKDQVTWRAVKKGASELWRILRGSLHYRYAVGLLGAGMLLLGGPPLFYVIAIHVLGIAADQLNYELSEFWDNAIKVVGVGLIIASVAVFLRGERTQTPPDDIFDFTIPEGWTFESVMRKIARNHIVEFEGFDDDHLATKLQGREIVADTMLDALGLMRSDTYTPTLPSFDVIVENSKIIIRSKDGQ